MGSDKIDVVDISSGEDPDDTRKRVAVTMMDDTMKTTVFETNLIVDHPELADKVTTPEQAKGMLVLLQGAFDHVVEHARYMTPEQIVFINKKVYGVEFIPEAVAIVAKERWPDYTGEFDETSFLRSVLSKANEGVKDYDPDFLVKGIKQEYGAEVSREAIIKAIKERYPDYEY